MKRLHLMQPTAFSATMASAGAGQLGRWCAGGIAVRGVLSSGLDDRRLVSGLELPLNVASNWIRRSRRGTERPGALGWGAVAIFSVALFTIAVPSTADLYDAEVPASFLLWTVLCGALVVAPRLPRVATVVFLSALVGLAAATAHPTDQPWPLPITALIAFAALIVELGLWGNWIWAVVAWWSGILLMLAVVVFEPKAARGDWGGNLILASVVTAAMLVAAIAISQRRRIRSELASAKRDVELEQARRAHTEERGRIAREMHDVVVHSMSLVHMQASSAPYRLSGLDEATRAEFENIARSARSALNEMRQVLGALRVDDDDIPLAPQPQLADLVELALLTTRAGSRVDLTIDESAKTSSAILQVTAYRIVQEALGNAVRHAPGARSNVVISATAVELTIDLSNEAPNVIESPLVSSELADQGGRGLRGMRERVEQLGGHLDHGPISDGGFFISARLPLTPSDQERSD